MQNHSAEVRQKGEKEKACEVLTMNHHPDCICAKNCRTAQEVYRISLRPTPPPAPEFRNKRSTRAGQAKAQT